MKRLLIICLATVFVAACAQGPKNGEHGPEAAVATETALTQVEQDAYSATKNWITNNVQNVTVVSQPLMPLSITKADSVYEVAGTFIAQKPGDKETRTVNYTSQIKHLAKGVDSIYEWHMTSFVVDGRDVFAEAKSSDNSAVEEAEKDVLARIKSHAKEEYPNDYTLQEFSYKQEVKAYRYMQQATDMEVKRHCQEEYPEDYTLQKFSYEQEVKAKRNMQ